jgi:hypothetical protein
MKLRAPIPTRLARQSIGTSRLKFSCRYSSLSLTFASECGCAMGNSEYPDWRLRGMLMSNDFAHSSAIA